MPRELFSGRELVLADEGVLGLRAWNVKPDGRLIGVYGKQGAPAWEPGVNRAKCYSDTFVYARSRPWAMAAADLPENFADDGCYLDFDRCSHGFYAYYDEEAARLHGYHGVRSVVGICEATGKIDIGTAGYRAQNAKIVALTCPRLPGFRFGKLSGDSLNIDPMSIMAATIAVTFIVMGVVLDQSFVGSALVWSAIALMRLSGRVVLFHLGHPIRRLSLHRLYPDVKIYSTTKQMLKHHPIEKPCAES